MNTMNILYERMRMEEYEENVHRKERLKTRKELSVKETRKLSQCVNKQHAMEMKEVMILVYGSHLFRISTCILILLLDKRIASRRFLPSRRSILTKRSFLHLS
jgi:hypothetical protein